MADVGREDLGLSLDLDLDLDLSGRVGREGLGLSLDLDLDLGPCGGTQHDGGWRERRRRTWPFLTELMDSDRRV